MTITPSTIISHWEERLPYKITVRVYEDFLTILSVILNEFHLNNVLFFNLYFDVKQYLIDNTIIGTNDKYNPPEISLNHSINFKDFLNLLTDKKEKLKNIIAFFFPYNQFDSKSIDKKEVDYILFTFFSLKPFPKLDFLGIDSDYIDFDILKTNKFAKKICKLK